MPADAPAPPAAPFVRGIRAGFRSPMIFVTFGTFIGVGALAHDLGFSLAWAVTAAVLLWAAPAQVIVMSALAGGAALVGIAVAVALSSVRLMPMVVSLIPMMRGPKTRIRDLLVPAHFVSVTIWVEGLRLLPAVPREQRVAFLNGMGTSFGIVAALSTVGGFYLAAGLPLVLRAALLMLTPLTFLMSTAGNARVLSDRLALALGLVIGPLLAVYQVQLDLLWGGIIGGTLGYAIHRLRRGAR
jgi:predicted branched-subunit amino acid permease